MSPATAALRLVGSLARTDERRVTAMAETKRMTCEQVVGYLLEGVGLDVLRESLSWVVQQLMEAEVSELVGAERGARAQRAGARVGRAGGVRRRRLDAQGRPGGRVAGTADLEERGVTDLHGPRRAGRGVPQPAARGPLSV